VEKLEAQLWRKDRTKSGFPDVLVNPRFPKISSLHLKEMEDITEKEINPKTVSIMSFSSYKLTGSVQSGLLW